MLEIYPIPILKSNYVWCLIQDNLAWVVDPGDHTPVVRFLQQRKLNLQAILITHHHWDHISGVQNLLWHFSNTSIPVIGPKFGGNSPVTQAVNDRAVLKLAANQVEIIATPGHTLDHISYWLPEQRALFCGDTLFSCGCGKIFDGSTDLLLQSLNKLAALPDDSRIYCTHEYTLDNIRFAAQVEPGNTDLEQYRLQSRIRREKNCPTLPTTMALEKHLNPFMRCTEASVVTAASNYAGKCLKNQQEVFAMLRAWKDRF